MFIVILIVLFGCLGFCIFGLVCSAKNANKRKKLQEQADNSFKTINGNYQFYYSIKSFKKETGVVSKIFVQPVLGFSDLKYADTNSFTSIEIYINDVLVESTVETKGLSAMSEFVLPDNCVVNGSINANFTVNTCWYLGGLEIKDTLTFVYGKTL